jgi:hypothetical protein
MEIRYSPNSGANIAGPSEEALAIKERILGLAKVGVGRIELSGNSTGSPAPYDRWLKRLIISAGNGPTIALVGANREFNITANPECLRVLASFFSVPEGAQPAWHTHVQFYPGNQWISEDSGNPPSFLSGSRWTERFALKHLFNAQNGCGRCGRSTLALRTLDLV